MRFTVRRGQKKFPTLGISNMESYLLSDRTNSVSPCLQTSKTMALFKWRGQNSKLLFDYSFTKGYMQAVELHSLSYHLMF